MSTAELERELRQIRESDYGESSSAIPLSVEQALAYRDAGNLPDEAGRTLRLVLHIDSNEDARRIDERRLAFEPDYLDAPRWRRRGSRPVNIVPLRAKRRSSQDVPDPWWTEPSLARLEAEWQATGRLGDLVVPGELRGFVFKTVLALRSAGRPVTPDSVADAVSRWLTEDDVRRIREALRQANVE